MLRKDVETERYELGFRLFELGSRVQRLTTVTRIADPILHRLTHATGGTSILRVLDGDDLLVLSAVESQSSLRVHYSPGTRVPINFGSGGKVILANLPKENLEDIIAKGRLKKFTEKTVTKPAVLNKQLTQIRLRGWACTSGEAIPGSRGISAPIRSSKGNVFGAIGLTFPAISFPSSKVPRVARLVVQAADEISGQLGWGALRLRRREA
jgi:DNA-binding IclR family transcriptional regulator